MYRRLLLLLLILFAPLQGLAALQMGLSSHHMKDLSHLYESVRPGDLHSSAPHDDHDVDPHDHAELAKHGGPDANCTACDLCVPPLAFTTDLKLDAMPGAAAFGPMPTSTSVSPRSFDRPPRSARLA